MKNRIKDFLKRTYKAYPQIYWLITLILGWFLLIPIIYYIDPSSGTFDMGIFQIPLFAVIMLAFYSLAAWIIVKTIFGYMFRYAKQEMKEDFKKLQPWQKITSYYLLFFALVFALVMLSRTLVITPIR